MGAIQAESHSISILLQLCYFWGILFRLQIARLMWYFCEGQFQLTLSSSKQIKFLFESIWFFLSLFSDFLDYVHLGIKNLHLVKSAKMHRPNPLHTNKTVSRWLNGKFIALVYWFWHRKMGYLNKENQRKTLKF